METIPKNTCTKIGSIQKPHGIKGELSVRFQEQFYETLEKADTLFIEADGLLVPFFITGDGIRFRTGDSAIITLEWVNTEEEARKLTGFSVYVKNDDIKGDDNFFDFRILEGFLLIDQRKSPVGKIGPIHDFSGNVVLEVNYHGKKIMVPFNEDFLIGIDQDRRILALDLPDGLLTMND
ncbi:MAG: ribosome maturation factor RimM [Prolixibacteraceae bacterium]|jgi:16S rRNA processing protein RimM|nr:ribosome maturation factor RimM [Prolixibacteraceae bacterium]